jgi:hypothetical protein
MRRSGEEASKSFLAASELSLPSVDRQKSFDDWI